MDSVISSRQRGNVYRWIYALKTKLNNGSTSKLELDVLSSGKKIALCALFSGKHVSLGLWHESVPLGDLGTCIIKECSEEEMQENLLPLFSRLCIYAFLGINDEDFMHLKISKVEESLRSKISKARVYEAAFNILFYAACHSRLIRNKHQHKLKELVDEMLHEIGAEATESLMKSLASLSIHGLNLSYCSRLSDSMVSNSWRIHCYCQRSEMERKSFYGVADESLEYALNHQLLQCIFSLDSVVSMEDCIKVELKIDNLKCKSLQLDSYEAIPRKLEKEWYFPAKIRITMGPEEDCNSGVHDISLGTSSQNPRVSGSEARSNEIAVNFQLGVTSSLSFGFRDGRTITSNHERKNWRNDRRSTTTAATLEFTLRDNYGKDVVDFEPRNRNQGYKACQALAQGMEPDRPFTQDGGVRFEQDVCGPPMMWRLRSDRNLKRGTLKWFVEVEIWLGYYPNKYDTHYMEIRYQKFRELVELSLVQDSSPVPQPTSVQLFRDTAPHPTELQPFLLFLMIIFRLLHLFLMVIFRLFHLSLMVIFGLLRLVLI
ncbi:hypothetical protein SUGI_0555200 [Cryptomeria japonica]|nr:hypothetical protein SUGI_0555200 [Cryptomeria japonica]